VQTLILNDLQKNPNPTCPALRLDGLRPRRLGPQKENAATRLPQRLAKVIPKGIIAKIPFGSRENFSTTVSLRLSMSQ
jgi:hypothetical protein